jgi:uncharacterized membrane protein
MAASPSVNELNIKRLEALIDGVFAIAMTILVLSIEVPENKGNLSGVMLHKAVLDQSSQIIAYVISFLLLALFWTIHHKQFSVLVKTNHTHIWINIFMLIFICLIPYTTSLKGNFPNDWISNLYFNVNVLIISIIFLINWLYATKKNRLTVREYSGPERKRGTIRNVIFVSVAALAVLSSYYFRDNSSYLYLLIPVLKYIQKK